MREPTERENIQKEDILGKCLECLVEKGLEGATIKELSESTGMTASSLYYWFSDKEEIVLDVVEYGVKVILEDLFEYVSKPTHDINEVCRNFPEVIQKHNSSLRAVFQVASSPKYGQQIIELSGKIIKKYSSYADELSNRYRISPEKLCKTVDMLISVVTGCIVWQDWDKLPEMLNCIFKHILCEE